MASTVMGKERARLKDHNVRRTAASARRIAAALRKYRLCAALVGLVGCTMPLPTTQPVSSTTGQPTSPATSTVGGQGTFAGGSVNGQPGQTAAVPITIHVGGGANVAFFAVTFTVVPQGGAAAITAPLTYQSVVSPGPDMQAAVAAQGKLAVGYVGKTISPALSGTAQVGSLMVPIPAGATGSYQVQLSKISAGDAAGRRVAITGQAGTITVRARQ